MFNHLRELLYPTTHASRHRGYHARASGLRSRPAFRICKLRVLRVTAVLAGKRPTTCPGRKSRSPGNTIPAGILQDGLMSAPICQTALGFNADRTASGFRSITRKYAKTAISGRRRACSHSCNDLKLSPNVRANSDCDRPRLSRTSRTRRANSSACTSRIAPISRFPAAECFADDCLVCAIKPPLALTRLPEVPVCRQQSNQPSRSSHIRPACTLDQLVQESSRLLGHRRAFPFRSAPTAPFVCRQFQE